MKIKKSLGILCVLGFLGTTTMIAQDRLFTLEDLNFGGTNYRKMLPRNLWLSWWGDQLMYQDAEEGGSIDAKGNRKALFSLKDVGADLHSAMDATYPYPDQPLVLLSNREQQLLYNFETRQVEWTQPTKEATVSEWSSASRALAYKKADQQLYVLDGEKEAQLTTDGSREIVYGEAVHRNEFGIDGGLFWSPDGQKLAFYRMDQSMVTDYPQVDIFPREATYEPDKYPMAGMTSHEVTVGVYDLKTQETVYLQAGDPKDRYFTNIAWDPSGKTIYMFELNRAQNDCRLVTYDALTGEKKAEIYRETSTRYVEPQHPVMFLPWDDTKFIMQSQKDGYNHLYLFDADGRELRQLTKGSWVVVDVLGFDKKQKRVIIASNEQHPLQRNLYAVSISNGRRTLLDNGRGVHYGRLSATGRQLYDKYQEPTVPRNIDLINVTNGKHQNLLTATDPWEGYQQPTFESGTIKAADGTTNLYYRMVKPAGFDPQKKYPTVVYVYGGPHAHNVDASWHWASRSWETYMAQKGYLLFILDNRGSENRGRDFEQATFHQLGQVEMQDQMQGVAFLRTLPYVDMERLGVHGWSFGGFMTISLMLNHPDVFKVGVAGGPVIDWKWYEVMYGERYMGTPENNPEGYAKSSLIDKAKNLKGKLQIITGYNDATVVPQHCLSFLDACVKAGTQPDFFAYPGEEHNMRGHASVHLHERITQYFEDYLRK
ncbi:MAG: S9 family peptidase [Prevotella sp.]|nr:S9 family peptidase [Prevotella sp.]